MVLRLRGRHALFPPRGEEEKSTRELERHARRDGSGSAADPEPPGDPRAVGRPGQQPVDARAQRTAAQAAAPVQVVGAGSVAVVEEAAETHEPLAAARMGALALDGERRATG